MNAGDLLEANVRIAGMWPIPGPMAAEKMLDALEDREVPQLKELAQSFGWSEDEIDHLFDGDCQSGRDAWESMFERLIQAGKSGWVCRADTPVMEGGPGRRHYSWGYYHTEVLFATDVGDVLKMAIEWADARYDEKEAA